MSGEVWEEVYDRLADLVQAHRTTLVFVNTRRLAERVARHLGRAAGRGGGDRAPRQPVEGIAARRRGAAQGRKLQALVATASLELGIDIGHVDLVCQLGSPRRISTFLQRVGRSGHTVRGTPKGRLFPLTRDELVECTALLALGARGRARPARDPRQAARRAGAADRGRGRGARTGTSGRSVRAGAPRLSLPRPDASRVRRGRRDARARASTTSRGRRGALMHHDAINGRLRGRRGARLAGDHLGRRDPGQRRLPGDAGAGEHLHRHASTRTSRSRAWPGDIFQLGNTSLADPRVQRGTVRVEDAQGQPPTIPFWLGEARPGARSCPAVACCGEVREEWTPTAPVADADAHSSRPSSPSTSAKRLRSGALPTQDTLVAERFFDEAGGMQLVHPLAVRQPGQPRLGTGAAEALLPPVQLRAAGRGDRRGDAAVAGPAALVPAGERLPLPASRHGARHPGPGAARRARCSAPAGAGTRHRPRAAAEPGGRKAPPQIQRMEAEDLLAAAFPDAVGLPGEHPRRPRDPRPSAGAADHRRLPARGDGPRRAAQQVLREDPRRRDPAASRATSPSRRRWPTRS